MENFIKAFAAITAIILHGYAGYHLLKRHRENKKHGVQKFLYKVVVENEIPYETLTSEISKIIPQFGYRKADATFRNPKIKNITFWKKKSFSINNGFILIELGHQNTIENLVDFLQENKKEMGKVIGYTPFLYPVGLQVIVIGNPIVYSNLKKNPVDLYNNQKAILQSVILIDNNKRIIYESTILATSVLKKYYDTIFEIIINLGDNPE